MFTEYLFFSWLWKYIPFCWVFFKHFVVVQSSGCVQLFATPWTVACQAFLSLTASQRLPKFMIIASVMPFSHLFIWCLLVLGCCKEKMDIEGIFYPWCILLMLGKIWGQEEKGVTEDEMVRYHHWLNGHEFAQTQGDSEGQRSLACCSPWGRKESDMTEHARTHTHTHTHTHTPLWECLCK